MRAGFADAGRAHADEARLLAELREVHRAEITHAGLNAADELRQDHVHGTGRFLQRLDAFGCDLRGRGGGMTVARGGPGLHRGEATHAAVLFVALAVDFHDLTGRFRAAGEHAAANHRLRQGQRLHDVTGLRDAAVRDDAHALARRRLRRDVKRRELRNAHARDDARRANRAWSLADLDGVRARLREELHTRCAGHVASDDRQLRERVANHRHRFADAFAEAVRGGNGDHVHAAFHEFADVCDDAIAVEFAEHVARGGDCRAADEPELGIARRLELSLLLLRDALHVAHREEAVQLVVIVHDEELVDARMVREKLVGARDGIFGDLFLADGLNLVARCERLHDLAFGVALFHDVARQEAKQLAGIVHDGERAELELPFFHHLQNVADELVGRNLDRLLNQAVDVVLHAADFGELLLLLHVVVDEPERAVERHGDGHARFRHGVHVRRNDGDVQVQPFGQRGVELRVARENVGIERRQCDVVVGQRLIGMRGEEGVRSLVEAVVDVRNLSRNSHVNKCPRHPIEGNRNLAS